MMPRIYLVISLLAGMFTAAIAQASFDQSQLKSFANEMAVKHGFNAAEVESMLKQADFRDDIIRAISRPAEAKPWRDYRKIFIQSSRIEGGAEFLTKYTDLLQRAEQEFGVPAEIITAIIGVETRYGNHAGRYPVVDALATLAFGYPPRSRFFRSELEHALLLSREEKIDLNEVKGSYAGAMGWSQFISSSYRHYAIDYDGDGQRDLWNSPADIIGSVANYFKRHGWQPGQPITYQLKGSTDQAALIDAGMKPSIPYKDILNSGLKPILKLDLPEDTITSLIKLEAEDGDEFWLGLHNFYVITRYNHSNLYAMAVYQLSREIKQAHRQ